MTELLELNEIECQYEGQIVISGLNLTLRKGDIGCLLGPSGCGKSTILRAIAGFLPLSKGSISLRGQTISSPDTLWPPEKRKIGMVFQDYALFPHLTVAQNVAFGLHKHPKKAQFQQALKQLELVDLKELANRYPHELSGGQQQRVALARALAPEPDLILLDEPFSNLDAELRKSLSLNVRDILKRLGTTAILVTHDQHEAFAMSDAVGVLKDGIVQQWDTPFNLYHEPANTFIATFVGQGSFIPGKMKSHDTIVTELGEIQGNRAYQWESGTAVNVLIRPDDIILDEHSQLTAAIINKTFAGTSTLYRLRLGSGTQIESLLPSHQDYYVGEQIPIRVAADHLIAFQH